MRIKNGTISGIDSEKLLIRVVRGKPDSSYLVSFLAFILQPLLRTVLAAKTIASLTALPSEIDEAATVIEKKAKEVGKPASKDNKAKLLRDLLAEM